MEQDAPIAEESDYGADLPADTSTPAMMAVQGNTTTTDATVLPFDFSADWHVTGIVLDWMFGTEEYSGRAVSDVAGIFLDGVNVLAMDDGAPVFWTPSSSGEFADNTAAEGYPLST